MAFTGDDVLGRAAVDYPDVHSCVGRVETLAPGALQFFGDSLNPFDQTRRAKDCRRPEPGISPVRFATAHANPGEAVPRAGPHRWQAGRLPNDCVSGAR